jgi:predicted nucleic acid-binding protein
MVLDWLAAHDPSELFTTTLTLAEILYGLELLPSGKRRAHLEEQAEILFREYFTGRILPFDGAAARAFSTIAATSDRAGRPMSRLDAMIAATAKCHRAALATRNVTDFEHCGIEVINPWSE